MPSSMLKTLVGALLVLPSALAQCKDTGWCDFGEMSAHYKCEDVNSCLTVKLAGKADTSKYVSMKYNVPAMQEGAGATWKGFDSPASFGDVLKTQGGGEEGDDKAYFSLATALKLDGKTVGYLAVMQGIAIKDFELGSIATPVIPDGVGSLSPCMTTKVNGACTPKKFPLGSYKYSFAAYQTEDCENPSACMFALRSTLDTSLVGDVTLNAGTKEYTMSDIPAMTAIDSMNIGSFKLTFPTGANYNNESFDEKGAEVVVEEIKGKVIHLGVRVKTPGKGKFVMYDPTMAYNSKVFSAASVTSACSSTVLGLLAMALLW